MDIIFVTREGYRLPGARIRCYNFSRELNRYGINSTILSFSDTLGAKDGEEESRMTSIDKIIFNYRAFKTLIRNKKAILYIQRFNYHSLAPYLVHLFNKNKIILDLDDWEMREDPKYYFRIYPTSKAHYITRQIARKSIFCIAASYFLQNFLLQFNKNVYYVPSGVDTQVFRPINSKTKKNKLIFSWIGTLHRPEYIENIGFALECFKSLRRKYGFIYFDIIGDGIYKDELKKLLEAINDSNVYFKGWLPPDEIPGYLDTIDIGLMPIARVNKFNLAKSPTKLFEYMAMAKPTVSSAIGEAVHIIQDGYNGFLAEDKNRFIEKMEKLIIDCNLREQIGQQARQTVEDNYSIKILGQTIYMALKKYLAYG